MINRHCRKFIKFLSKHEPDYENGIYTYYWIEEHYPEEDYVVDRMIRYLEKEGVVTTITRNNLDFGIRLEEPGRYTFQFLWERFKSFMFRSVLTPVIVSALTTLATLWLKKLL